MAKTKVKDSLPNKPSELILLALDDMSKCLEIPDYQICMDVWHVTSDDGHCYVCLAGSVMAQTLGCKIEESVGPYATYPEHTANKLSAINCFRQGNVADGFMKLNIKVGYKGLPESMTVCPYDKSPEQFVKDMRLMVGRFAEVGL